MQKRLPHMPGLWILLSFMAGALLILSCKGAPVPGREQTSPSNHSTASDFPGVPKSSIYEVTIREGGRREKLVVFQSSCPEYQPGYMNIRPVNKYPLDMFKGRSISWVNFSFSDRVKIEVRVLDRNLVPSKKSVRIFPSRYGITPVVQGQVIHFTMTKPGQCSVEIGEDGYKNGLLIFANPPETDKPDPAAGNYYEFDQATHQGIDSVPATYTGIYFAPGVHDIGVYHVPANIKNIYLEAGSWVYGAIVMDGRPNVKIFGRGVLSQARLNYRESHGIEAINESNNIDLEGIVLADTKFFAVRLIGTENTVKWVKIVGGWTYNTDGISAFAGSSISNCFIWANDDSIKPYRGHLRVSDCVVWQLNNGAVIQLSWGTGNATDVTIRNVDVLHAEWNNNAPNRGVLSCIGDKFSVGGMFGLQQSFLIENLTTETPVPYVFNVRPNPASPNQMHGMVFKNWDVRMDMNKRYGNIIECSDPAHPFDGLVFDHVILNGVPLTESNWLSVGKFTVKNVATPIFK